MKMNTPDPSLAVEGAKAKGERVDSIQDVLKQRTAQFAKVFGTRARRPAIAGP